MKIWKDANEIGMIHEMPNDKLKEIDIEMRKKPNFNKNQEGEKGCIKNEKKNKKCIKTYKKCKRCKKDDSIFRSK